LGGTPGNKQGLHYWFRVNKPDTDLTQWKLFHFDWRNNTTVEPKSGMRVCDAIKAEIDKDINKNPLIVLTPSWRQEVEGEWVIETDAKVYKSTNKNFIDRLPDGIAKGCTYILSMDLGYYDATAFVI